ncbi:hypothetical protein LTR69_006442 [Exophiala sideris]|uniref:Uncharacterized protein n=1 Tax=Exophiala sideris TaxID=1016849 RepID=A0ABR0J942_9EURO|nr:hypothetical protein LTR69_006442 [Exophiala sideris]
MGDETEWDSRKIHLLNCLAPAGGTVLFEFRRLLGLKISTTYTPSGEAQRLRLAQDGTGSLSPPPSRLSILPPSSPWITTTSLNSLTLLKHGVRQPGLLLNGNRLRKRRLSTRRSYLDSPAGTWFASLSPAVQRKLFSKEECSFYNGDTNIGILDAADETLRRRSWHTSRLLISERRISDDETIVDWEDIKCEDKLDSDTDMCDYSTDGFRWLDDEPELNLKLDDYHEAIAETQRRTSFMSEPAKRPGFRHRNASISSMSIRRGRSRSSTSSSRPPLDAPPTPALPSKPSSLRTPSFSLKPIRSKASLKSIDPQAAHYQDPAARMKLRVYLASPQKFDEAIEFGFPQMGDRHRFDHPRPMTSPAPRPETNRTFFHDNTPSLSGDDSEDEDEPDTLYDPRTPEDAFFQMHRPPPQSTVEANTGWRPSSARRQPSTYARSFATDREMTLHMTLTRPDLRTPGEALPEPRGKVNAINAVPLERPQLANEPNSVSIWDTLPPAESKMKRFLRRLKLR